MSESEPGSERDPVEQLLESFLRRLRGGERPSLDDYAARCPERAEEIRELFPALVEIERLKPPIGADGVLADGPITRHGPAGGPMPPHPERLGEYRIIRVVGYGGMGVVYEAEHESLRSRVALKVMHPGFRADASHLRRLRQEARSAARLHHTNIVPVFDFGEQDGIYFYAMQYIAGVGLNDVLDDVRRLRDDVGGAGGARTGGPDDDRPTRPMGGSASVVAHGLLTGRFAPAPISPSTSQTATVPLDPSPSGRTEPPEGADPSPPEPKPPAAAGDAGSSSFARQPESTYFREIARLGAQVADALDYAHRQGVVHRDIKPSNLLLDAQGNAWVTDFGLAKLIEEEDLSQSRELVGTLRFMAPERFRGVTDRRSDLYALGATLYELLALRPAFNGRDQVELIDQVTHQPATSPRQHDRRIPRDLETLVLKAMAKDPKDRFASAGELRDELRRFLEGRPIRSRPVPVYEQFWRWCRRNRTLAIATITAAALLVFVAVSAPIVALVYRSQVHRLEVAEREGRLELGKSHQAEGAALQRTGLIGQRFVSLDRLREAAGLLREHPSGRDRLPELRDQVIAAMGLTDLRLIRRREIGPMMAVSWDPTLETYATTEWLAKPGVGGVVVVRSMADDRELLRIERPTLEYWWGWTGFSPDGRHLMVYYDLHDTHRFDIWDIGRKVRVSSLRGRGLFFHPDGRRLLLRRGEKEMVILDLAGGREERSLRLDLAPAMSELDPEGRRLAVSTSTGPRRVSIIEVETARVLATWSGDDGEGGDLSWSRDGRLLATINGDGRVFVRDVERGTLTSVLHEHMGGAGSCDFAPRGSLLLTRSFSGPSQIWDASTGRLLVSAPNLRNASFSSDGRRLACHDGAYLEVWEVAHEEELITLNPGLIGNRTEGEGRGSIAAGRFSPDGRMIALATREATHLHDARDGRELARLETGSCETLLFDRDGRNLLTYGERGLFRWPIHPDCEGLRVGPPAFLHEALSPSRLKAAWLPDGRTLAVTDHDHSRIVLLDTTAPHPARRRGRGLHTPWRSRMIAVDVSPDGRWLAAGSWNDPGAYVWDLPRRRFERVLPRGDTVADGHTLPAFSPDGRWLVLNAHVEAASGYYFWEVGTWRRGPYIPRPTNAGWGEPVFSPDGAMIALSVDANRIRLAETATGRTIAHLTTLEPLSPRPMAFSPDGTRLLAATERQTALVWDLRRIRERLRTIDLDWDRPPYPAEGESPGAEVPRIRSIRVIGAEPEPAARRAADLAACEARLRDHPDDAEALLDKGWLELKLSRPAEAVVDLKRGASLWPGDAEALYLLAAAQLEAGDRAGACATLERYLSLATDDPDARLSKALAELQLGRLEEADADLGKALELDPTRGLARLNRAEVRLRLGRLEGSLSDFDELVQTYPGDGDLLRRRSEVHERMGRAERALADLRRAAELPKASAQVLNVIAWKLVAGPPAFRDPPRAVELARKAVASSPDNAMYLNTLGVALYRAGEHAEAVSILERSLAAGDGQTDAFDLFFLAMARHRLGRADRARADFDRAVEWRRAHPVLRDPGWAAELRDFEAEARAVLGGPLPDLPADVFAPGRSGAP